MTVSATRLILKALVCLSFHHTPYSKASSMRQFPQHASHTQASSLPQFLYHAHHFQVLKVSVSTTRLTLNLPAFSQLPAHAYLSRFQRVSASTTRHVPKLPERSSFHHTLCSQASSVSVSTTPHSQASRVSQLPAHA